MAVAATVALPVWKQVAQREKEAELIFRGEQYARAITLFQRRVGPGALPPDIEFLVENRFLRRAYRDPITGGQFQIVRGGEAEGPARAGPPPGVAGVVSTSQERSIRLYGDRNYYNEWQFLPRATAKPDGGAQAEPRDSGPRAEPAAEAPSDTRE
jgi:type II secretory pathway pseudopilin PulG